MHYQNTLFSTFQPQIQPQSSQICLVLTEFPIYSDLQQLKEQLLENYNFITNIEVINNQEIQCYFTSMSDLVQMDQGRHYGAERAFIRQPQQTQKMKNLLQNSDHKRVFLNSQQTYSSQKDYELHSYKFISELEDQSNPEPFLQNPSLIHRPQMQRLTSLEDEIVELQQLREQLNLFKDEPEHDKTFETQGIPDEEQYYTCDFKKYSQKSTQDNQSEQCQNGEQLFQDNHNQCKTKTDKKQMVIAVLQGAALTAIFFGGIKLLRNLLN